MCLIETQNLSKSFKRAGRSFFAVKNINLEIHEKDFIHIVGRSGSGKSTLLNLLAGILKPTEGEVLYKKRSLKNLSDGELSLYRNENLGFVPQTLGTIPNLNVLENVALPYFLHNREGTSYERASMLLDMVGILHLKDDFPKNLSGGELKRVLIARSLINEPEILLLDEPTSDLDSKTTIEIMELLKEINKKTTLVIVTHEIDILKYGDVLYEMDDGNLVKKRG